MQGLSRAARKGKRAPVWVRGDGSVCNDPQVTEASGQLLPDTSVFYLDNLTF